MKKTINSYSLLVIGKTQETKSGFKRYVGVGTSRILAFNPTKEELDKIMGYESSYEPVYVEEKEDGKEAHIHFIVETDPDLCNGISIKTKAMFTLKAKPALSSSGESVYVIDDYGNYCKMNYEDAKAHKPLPENYKINHAGYRIACEGEVDLITFLRKFLNLPESMEYINGEWVLKSDSSNAKFRLEHIKDFFKGDFSEIKEALDYQPNNHIKLLYGVKTKEDGSAQQVVCTGADYIMRNYTPANALAKVAKTLANAKAHNKYQNIDYRVCELQEWDVKPTNLEAPKVSDDTPQWGDSDSDW